MTGKPGTFSLVVVIILCLISTLTLPPTALALTDRPPKTDAEGNIVPEPSNPFVEGDALRYGGLFGPIKEMDPWERMAIERENPHLLPPPFTRNLGFAIDESHYPPITSSRSSS